MSRFENKNVLVTGGNSGIGKAAATAFAKEGARVIITGRDQETLSRVAAEIGGDTLALVSDASSLSSIDSLVSQLGTQVGRLDAIFVNAGIAHFEPFADFPENEWDRTFNTNVKGPYFLIQKAAGLMTNGGSIVLNGSQLANTGMAGASTYAASKAALISLVRTLSAELLEQGIRVNVVSPGPVATPIYERLGFPEEVLSEMATDLASQVPLGRFGTPEEIAATVLHLASDESGFIVGTEIVSAGGLGQL